MDPSVAAAGDVNDDGFDDLLVGAQRYQGSQFQGGRAFVFHGSPTGLSSVETWGVESNQANTWYAASASPAGDVNGDGYSDVIVGAYHFTNTLQREGRAFVYHGFPTDAAQGAVFNGSGLPIPCASPASLPSSARSGSPPSRPG